MAAQGAEGSGCETTDACWWRGEISSDDCRKSVEIRSHGNCTCWKAMSRESEPLTDVLRVPISSWVKELRSLIRQRARAECKNCWKKDEVGRARLERRRLREPGGSDAEQPPAGMRPSDESEERTRKRLRSRVAGKAARFRLDMGKIPGERALSAKDMCRCGCIPIFLTTTWISFGTMSTADG